jgi:hypothetical protein
MTDNNDVAFDISFVGNDAINRRRIGSGLPLATDQRNPQYGTEGRNNYVRYSQGKWKSFILCPFLSVIE